MTWSQNDLLIALLILLVVLSAIPIFSTGITWFAVLLLIIVWTNVYQQKGA